MISFFIISKHIRHILIFEKLPGHGSHLGVKKTKQNKTLVTRNLSSLLSFTLKICFEREIERAKLMTAFPSLIFSMSEQCAPISSLLCGTLAILHSNRKTNKELPRPQSRRV